MAEKTCENQQSSVLELSRISACRIFLAVAGAVALSQRIVEPNVAQNQLNCKGSRPHSRMTHQEGVVSLTPRILFSTVSSHF